MKNSRAILRSLIAAISMLAAGSAHAHPGHSPLTGVPHVGHEGEFASLFVVLAAAALIVSARWFASRGR